MAFLDDVEEQLPVCQHVVVYGPPKAGKTELVGKLSEHFNLMWVDMENGASTLTKLPAEWKKRINLVRIPDSKDLPIAIETSLKLVSGAPGTVCMEHGKFNCALCGSKLEDEQKKLQLSPVGFKKLGPRWIIVFDSLTQLSASAMNWVMRNKGDDFKPERDDWGNLKFIMEKFLTNLQAAGYNVVVISHEDEVDMVDGTSKLVPVSGSRNTSRNTAKYFDHVIYLSVKNKKHVAGSATTYAASVLTGSRTDVEIEKMEEGSLLPVFEHLLKFPLDDAKETVEELRALATPAPKAAAPAVTQKIVTPVAGGNSATAAAERLAKLRNQQS